MASRSKSLPANVPGEFFVDASCIDCDACRWIAPETFDRAAEQSRVRAQPATPEQRRQAFRALIACPTGSIGGPKGPELDEARRAWPVAIDGPVHHCGWHAEASFGAASYLVVRPPEEGGNVLVDSPRFSEHLARRIEELGGVATMFLTHADDVADHERFRSRFGCRRVLHRADAGGGTAGVEVFLEGLEPVQLDPDVLLIPVPGHTAGSTCLLFRGEHLFSGDHLAWSERLGHPYAFRSACWHDWGEQIASMERLARFDFEWILPGHGRRCRFERARMRREMRRCVDWMRGALVEAD